MFKYGREIYRIYNQKRIEELQKQKRTFSFYYHYYPKNNIPNSKEVNLNGVKVDSNSIEWLNQLIKEVKLLAKDAFVST